MAADKKPTKPTAKPSPKKIRVRTVRGVSSFRRSGIAFTREWQELPGNISKVKLDSIRSEKRLEVESEK